MLFLSLSLECSDFSALKKSSSQNYLVEAHNLVNLTTEFTFTYKLTISISKAVYTVAFTLQKHAVANFIVIAV